MSTSSQPGADATGAPKNLHGHVYPITATATDDPSLAQDASAIPTPFVGVAFSGGGSRAMSLSMGALMGLRDLGLTSKISFLSTVSGGSWAGVTYTFLPESISDDVFLPPTVAPGSLTWFGSGSTSLGELSPQAMGSAATRLGITEVLEKIIELRIAGHPDSTLWQRAIGELVLAPFGLGDGSSATSPARYYSWTPWWLQKVILDENPGLSANDFYLVNPRSRPYLICNSTFVYPPAVGSGGFDPNAPETELYLFEQTPITNGIVPTFPNAGAPNPGQPTSSDLGGGYVDPFISGAVAPTSPPVDSAFTVPAAASRYALSDAAGTSSAAFVTDVIAEGKKRGLGWIDGIVPRYDYWPVTNAGIARNQAYEYYFGDGGNLENTGLMALLRRGIPNIASFINTENALKVNGTAGPNPSWQDIIVDEQLPPLFGYQPWSAANGGYAPIPQGSPMYYANNQVFSSSEFPALLQQLWGANYAGGSAIYLQQGLTLLPNARYGISGGATVNILWVYNTPVSAFTNALTWEVRDAMKLDPEMWRFPNFDTVLQLHLNNRQVNLLGQLSAWNVTNTQSIGGYPDNASLFKQIFGVSSSGGTVQIPNLRIADPQAQTEGAGAD